MREYQEGVKNCSFLLADVVDKNLDMMLKLQHHVEDFRRCMFKMNDDIKELIEKGDRHRKDILKLRRANDSTDVDIKALLTRMTALETRVLKAEARVMNQDGSWSRRFPFGWKQLTAL